jgi:beta-galactosidase
MAIKVRYNGLEIDGNLLPLFSGTFHYWRSPREAWAGIFDSIKALGFQVVESYVPWSVHEIAPGDFDFGKVDEKKDLDLWLTLAAQKGFKVILRPGPCINSEMPDFGYPERILTQPRFYSRDSDGNPVVLEHQTNAFCVPSYANEELFSEFDSFLSAVAPILQKHLHPHGPVVSLQVDNELGYFFRMGAYDQDYSAPSLRLWTHFLDLKYRSVKAMNDAWGTKYKGFDEAPAPRRNLAKDPKGLRPCLDWVESREYQILWALSRLAELYRSRGLGSVPFFHNFYAPWTTPFNIVEIEADAGIDFCGLDSYPQASSAAYTVDQARYLSTSSRLAYFPEYGAGCWPFNWEVRDLHDQASTMLAPLMGGARAINFYMVVERERWLNSPLDNKGKPRPESAELFERFNKFLVESDWSKASPQNQGLLLRSRESQWLEAAYQRPGSFSEKGVYPPALLHEKEEAVFGAGVPGHAAISAFYDAGRDFVAQNHFSFGIGDSGVPTDKLKKHAFVILSNPAFLDENLCKRLRSYVEEGGLLVLGPCLPALNARFEALKAWEDLDLKPGKPILVGDGRMLYLDSFDAKAVGAVLRKGKIFNDIALSDTSLELALHKAGGRILLFARNPHAEARQASVLKEGKFVLKPLWASGKFLGGVEEREVSLIPHEIKVWEVIPVS